MHVSTAGQPNIKVVLLRGCATRQENKTKKAKHDGRRLGARHDSEEKASKREIYSTRRGVKSRKAKIYSRSFLMPDPSARTVGCR